MAAEKHGGPAFVTPVQQRLTVNELLDALKADYELRGKWNERVQSMTKKLRERFGAYRAAAVTSEAVSECQLELRETYRDATINRFCQLFGQAFKLAMSAATCQAVP